MLKRFCRVCDKPLIGKQRLFCSEACRKRYARSGQSTTAFVLELAGNGRKLSGNVRDFSNNRTFQVQYTVTFRSNLPGGEWDAGLLNDFMKHRVARIIYEVLIYEHPDWQIEVKAQKPG